MSKAPHVQNVQTPGEATEDETLSEGEQPAVAPDIMALVQAEVARQMAQRNSNPTLVAPEPLPTQEEALEMVRKDPKRRSVLSVDGWVTHPEPVVTAPFAKG